MVAARAPDSARIIYFCHYFEIYGRLVSKSDLSRVCVKNRAEFERNRECPREQRPPMTTNSIVRLIEMHASFNNILVNVNATLTACRDNLAMTNKSAISPASIRPGNDHRRYLIT